MTDAPGFTADHPPTEAVQLGAPRTEISTVKMQLPKGWSRQLPEAVPMRTHLFANGDVTYSFADGAMTAESRYTVLQSRGPKHRKEYLSWHNVTQAQAVTPLYPASSCSPPPISPLSKLTPDAPCRILAARHTRL